MIHDRMHFFVRMPSRMRPVTPIYHSIDCRLLVEEYE